MVSAIHSAVGGLNAASRRLEASASNIANARNSIPREDARVRGEPRQEARPGEDVVYEPVRVHQESVEGGGVRAEFVPYEPPHVEVYAPDDPVADDEGIVARPNVDYATEFVEMQRAEDAYRANIRTIIAEDEMTGSLIDEMG